MKGNSNPRYSRRVVRREIARRLKAEAERDQLRAQLQSLSTIGEDLITSLHRSAGNIQKVAAKINAELRVE